MTIATATPKKEKEMETMGIPGTITACVAVKMEERGSLLLG